jgi:hypothetical protein
MALGANISDDRTARAGLPAATTFRQILRRSIGADHGILDRDTRKHDDPPPSQTFPSIAIGSAASHLARLVSGSMGCVGVKSCTLGPICTSSPIAIDATSSATAHSSRRPHRP